jgi:hypothetical protein|tara:strand:- start:144 stop:2447 length:2304 start_codon:yes stop_codon:yes gene_type:complete
MLSLAPGSDAQLVDIPLTPDVANSSPSAHGGNLAHTTSDLFAYDPDNPTAAMPATNWSGATHYHGSGGNPTLYWTFDEILWSDGSDLQFDFYGRTGCCPDRDNNYDIALLTGGPAGTVVQEVSGNNAPDGGNPANYLRSDLGAGLATGQRFDTIRIQGNNGNFTIAEVRLAASFAPTSIISFSATPATVPSDAPVTFTWEFEAAATAARIVPISGDLDSLIGDLLPQTAAGSGSTLLNPGPDETTTYQLTVTVDGEDSSAIITVTVDNNPIISSFEVDQDTITAGTDITLTWDASNFDDLRLNDSPVDPDITSMVVSPLVSTTYTLEATNARGNTSASVSISVQDVPDPNAQLVAIPLTPDLNASSASGHGGNLAHTISDPFAYDPNNPTASLPATNWSGATHYHGNGGNPTLYWTFEEITWGSGSDLRFDFYGRTGCCPDRDNNFEVALLTGGPDGAVVAEVLGNNAPDGGNPANYLRINLGAVLTPGDRFDTIRIVGNNGNFTIAEVRLAGLLRTETLVKITDISFNSATSGLSISWESTQGKLYDILVSPDLSSPRTSWAELGGAQDIAADPSGSNTLVIALPFPGEGFVAVREKNPPPLFSDDLETGAAGWTTLVNDASGNTEWELGSPNGSTGPISGADDSANAWCTSLGNYGANSDISLRTPVIDLTGAAAALLTFDAYRDADGFGDTASVRFLHSGNQTQLGADVPIDMTVFDLDYIAIEVPVPAAAIGEAVLIEFNFVSEGSLDAFSGLCLDNVKVQIP